MVQHRFGLQHHGSQGPAPNVTVSPNGNFNMNSSSVLKPGFNHSMRQFGMPSSALPLSNTANPQTPSAAITSPKLVAQLQTINQIASSQKQGAPKHPINPPSTHVNNSGANSCAYVHVPPQNSSIKSQPRFVADTLSSTVEHVGMAVSSKTNPSQNCMGETDDQLARSTREHGKRPQQQLPQQSQPQPTNFAQRFANNEPSAVDKSLTITTTTNTQCPTPTFFHINNNNTPIPSNINRSAATYRIMVRESNNQNRKKRQQQQQPEPPTHTHLVQLLRLSVLFIFINIRLSVRYIFIGCVVFIDLIFRDFHFLQFRSAFV